MTEKLNIVPTHTKRPEVLTLPTEQKSCLTYPSTSCQHKDNKDAQLYYH